MSSAAILLLLRDINRKRTISESTITEPIKTEPIRTEPIKTESINTEPIRTKSQVDFVKKVLDHKIDFDDFHIMYY